MARVLKGSMYKTTNMKTIKQFSVLLIALSINLTAQVKNPKQGTYVPRNEPKNNPAPQNNNQNQERWGNGWNNSYPQGYVSLNFGYNSPNYGHPYNHNNYYNNGYSAKKASRYSIRAAGQLINQVIAFDNWNDTYSPLLAKAIRHYNYARELYWWGNYQAAHNHAERAKYLAWYSLQYFQNPGCDNGYDNGYNPPNPYSDPYNPNYRTGNMEDVGQKGNSSKQYETPEASKTEELDTKLPGSDTNDKELIRSFDKSELKDE